MNDLKKGQAALLKNQRISDNRTVNSFKKTLTKKVFAIGCVCLFLGNFLGGAWVTYHGPNVPMVWDGWGEKGYLELAALHESDEQRHESDEKRHESDEKRHESDAKRHESDEKRHESDDKRLAVALQRTINLEKEKAILQLIHLREKVDRAAVLKEKHSIKNLDSPNKKQLSLAGKNAVLESQNAWLWNSHNTFTALLEDDEGKFATHFPEFLNIATKKRVGWYVEIILMGRHPNLANYLMDNYPSLAWPETPPHIGNNP